MPFFNNWFPYTINSSNIQYSKIVSHYIPSYNTTVNGTLFNNQDMSDCTRFIFLATPSALSNGYEFTLFINGVEVAKSNNITDTSSYCLSSNYDFSSSTTITYSIKYSSSNSTYGTGNVAIMCY